MATSGRKKVQKYTPPKKRVTKYEDGSQSVSWSPTYKPAVRQGGGTGRSAVVKKAAWKKPPAYLVPDSAPAKAFLVEPVFSGKKPRRTAKSI